MKWARSLRVLAAAVLVGTVPAGHGSAAAEDHANAGDETRAARALLDQALRNFNADRHEQVRFTNYRGDKKRFQRGMEIWVQRHEERYRVLGVFTEPEGIRGTAVLVLPRDPVDSEDEQVPSNQYFIYFPSLRRVKRVSGVQRADAFFGTYLSQGDVEPRLADDYRVLEMEERQLDGEPVYAVSVAPRFEAGYDRALFTIAVRDRALLGIDQYSVGSLVRSIRTRRNWLEEVKGHVLPQRIVVGDGKGRGTTEVVVSDRVVDPEIPEQLFSTSYLLRKGR